MQLSRFNQNKENNDVSFMIIREAIQSDSRALIELAKQTPMKGAISLRTDREPDFFRLLNLSESFILLVAENDHGQLAGSFAATKDYMHINGKLQMVYYLRDLKVHPEYTGSMVAYHLVKKMYHRLLDEGANILCCTMASGNDAVVPFFRGRAGIPAFTEIAKYNIYQILPACNPNTPTRSTKINTDSLADFFNRQFKTFSAGPSCVQPGGLNDCVNFISEGSNNINAAIAAFDPFPYRQNVVTNYSFSIAIILGMLRMLKLFFRLSPLPKKNVPLRMLYARYYACRRGNEQSLKFIIQQLRNYAFEQKYHLVAFATDEKDESMNKLLKPLSSFVFSSSLLATSLQKDENMLCKMKQGIGYEDYSLV